MKRHARMEGGYVLLAMAALLLLTASIYFARGLIARPTSDESIQAQMLALRDAKNALIAYGAIEDSTPGSLPCPDVDNDGDSDTTNCSVGAPETLGCLPWKTLGLPPGEQYGIERIWYALSPTFKNSLNASLRNIPARQINLRNAGSMTVRTQSGGTSIIAAVIAPGHALTGQVRPPFANHTCDTTTASAYLEAKTIGTVAFSNASGTGDIVRSAPDANFNDTVQTLSHDEVLRPVLRTVLAAFAAPAKPALYGLRKYFENSGVTPSALQDITTTPNSMKRGADSANFDASFDVSSYPVPPKLVTGSAGCNEVANTTGTTSARFPNGAATSTKFPVSWLCYNDWYSDIEYQPSGTSTTQAELRLQLGGTSTYACSLQLDASSPAAESVICQ
jgi:hypothetical protein